MGYPPEPSNDVAPQAAALGAPRIASTCVVPRTTSVARLGGTSLIASIAT
jgi:hypothetical protein